MSKQLVFSTLALAALALGGCSAEPSDWRPDKKVSVDLVPPGTRSSGLGNYQNQQAAEGREGGHTGAIDETLNPGATPNELKRGNPVSAEEVRSVNDPSAPLTRSEDAVRSVRRPSDTVGVEVLSGPMQ